MPCPRQARSNGHYRRHTVSTSEAFAKTTSRRPPLAHKKAVKALDVLGVDWVYCPEHYAKIGDAPAVLVLVALSADDALHIGDRAGRLFSKHLADATQAVVDGDALVVSFDDYDLRVSGRGTTDLVRALEVQRPGVLHEARNVADAATTHGRRLADPLESLEVHGTVAGGAGPFGELRVGDEVVLSFRGSAVTVEAAKRRGHGTRIPYDALVELQIAGPGVETSGGGFIGGGFGLEGAATGILAASLLNAMTTRSSVTSIVGLLAPGAEIFVVNDQLTPDHLRLALSPVFAALSGQPTWAAELPRA